jgi:multicomponent K+:H+ antiporter subunit A
MAAGIIDHETGTRDIRRLNGLFKAMPITGTLAMVASASMAGVPLLNGFLSKEMFFAETVYVSSLPWVELGLPVVATLAGVFSVAYSLRFSYDIFFGPLTPDLPRTPHEPPHWMRVPVELLVLACVVVGIFPSFAVGAFLAAAAQPVVGGTLPAYSLAVWHGFNAPMLMSFVALGGGLLLYLVLRRQFARGRLAHTPMTGGLHGKEVFERALIRLSRLARWATRSFATRRLQPQMVWLFAVTLAAALLAVLPLGMHWGDRPRIEPAGTFMLMWVVGVVCAVGAAYQAKFHRLAALVLASGAGLITCLTFVWFSAPDLALTQLSVEIVTTVLLLLGLRWLPRRIEPAAAGAMRLRTRLRRWRDLLLSVAVGLGMAGLAFAMMTRQFPQSISPYFLERALPQGGGTNVVNVLLVDFRGFDTLGEQQRAAGKERAATDLLPPPTAQEAEASQLAFGYMLVPAILARMLLPVALLLALHLFLRGHNQPGGGFVAGLVVASALVLQYMVAGTQWVEQHFWLQPQRWIATGLGVAWLTGLGSLALGYPYLTTHTAHLHLPLLGDLHVASALFFDIGVFSLVVGATMLTLIALAHQSLRSHRAVREPLTGPLADGRRP